jgi:integrase
MKPVVALRQLHIKEVIKSQEDKGLAPRTIKQTLEILNPAFKSAIANRLIQFNPLDGIKIKLPKTKKIVTDATKRLTEIYNAITTEFEDNPFYQALYLFALQGRRKSEILNLKWEDVNLDQNYYILRNTKNNEEQKIFLPPRIKNLLLQLNNSTEYVFTSGRTNSKMVNINKVTARLKKRLGCDFTLHYLRNVIVSAMAEQGLDAIHLSGALGHNNAHTIDKYLTLNYLKGSELASKTIDKIIKDTPT